MLITYDVFRGNVGEGLDNILLNQECVHKFIVACFDHRVWWCRRCLFAKFALSREDRRCWGARCWDAEAHQQGSGLEGPGSKTHGEWPNVITFRFPPWSQKLERRDIVMRAGRKYLGFPSFRCARPQILSGSPRPAIWAKMTGTACAKSSTIIRYSANLRYNSPPEAHTWRLGSTPEPWLPYRHAPSRHANQVGIAFLQRMLSRVLCYRLSFSDNITLKPTGVT